MPGGIEPRVLPGVDEARAVPGATDELAADERLLVDRELGSVGDGDRGFLLYMHIHVQIARVRGRVACWLHKSAPSLDRSGGRRQLVRPYPDGAWCKNTVYC